MDKLTSSADNRTSRLLFVEYWARYVRTHSDKDWSSQQNVLINSQMQSAKHYPFSAKEYLEMKNEKCSRRPAQNQANVL